MMEVNDGTQYSGGIVFTDSECRLLINWLTIAKEEYWEKVTKDKNTTPTLHAIAIAEKDTVDHYLTEMKKIIEG